MKARDIRALERYIRSIADEMGLRDWTFKLVIADPNASKHTEGFGWDAMCTPVPARKLATLTFPSARRDDDLKELRHTVVHELVHCHFFGMWDTACQDLVGIIVERDACEVWVAGIRRHMEYGVDAVADAIAPRMPLIEWPTKGAR